MGRRGFAAIILIAAVVGAPGAGRGGTQAPAPGASGSPAGEDGLGQRVEGEVGRLAGSTGGAGQQGGLVPDVLGWLHRTATTAIEGGELAQQKSTSAKVRQLAAQLVGDHTALEKEVAALAAARGIELPGTGAAAPQGASGAAPQENASASGSAGARGLTALENLRGRAFDSAFLRWVAGQQRQGATEARSAQAQAQQAGEPALSALLGKLAPQLEARAQAAHGAQRSVAARTPPSAAARPPR